MLSIKGLKVSVDARQILDGVNLQVNSGELHVIMGPNGSGKSTLAQVIMGSPNYKVHSSRFTVDGKDISKLTPDKRARLGIFLGFQHPVEVPGVSVFNVLRKAVSAGPVSGFPPASVSAKGQTFSKGAARSRSDLSQGGISFFRQQLLEYASSLKLSDDFLRRSINEGFSGGEKKRSEILQMLALKPKLVILDEIDSGLDVDGLKVVASVIKQFTVHSPQSSVILITHYARILKYLKPDFVHVMVEGKIVKSGKMALARSIEDQGYKEFGEALQ